MASEAAGAPADTDSLGSWEHCQHSDTQSAISGFDSKTSDFDTQSLVSYSQLTYAEIVEASQQRAQPRLAIAQCKWKFPLQLEPARGNTTRKASWQRPKHKDVLSSKVANFEPSSRLFANHGRRRFRPCPCGYCKRGTELTRDKFHDKEFSNRRCFKSELDAGLDGKLSQFVKAAPTLSLNKNKNWEKVPQLLESCSSAITVKNDIHSSGVSCQWSPSSFSLSSNDLTTNPTTDLHD